MLPTPSIKFFPKVFQSDPKAIALANKLDYYILIMKTDISNFMSLFRADRVNSLFLDVLGNFISAGIKNYDSDVVKRRKIQNAVAGHKLRGTFIYDAKLKIDNITGYDSEIFRAIDMADWIITGDGLSEYEYFGTMGVDGVDFHLGLDISGDGTDVTLPGNISIDCHQGIYTPVLTSDQIAQIVEEIKDDVVPAYYRVYLGYTNTSGAFQFYSGGTIG